jgi:hypothetical protein
MSMMVTVAGGEELADVIAEPPEELHAPELAHEEGGEDSGEDGGAGQ